MEPAVAPPTLGELHRLPKSVILAAGLSLFLLIFIYLFYPAFPTTSGKTLAGWTWDGCNSYNGFFHGRLVPLFATSMLIMAWYRNRDQALAPSYWGLISLTVGLLFFYAGAKAIQPRYALFGAPLVIIGLSHYLFGRKITKATLFPAFFLWFAIPIPGLEGYIQGLLVPGYVDTTYQIGNILGMEIDRNGSMFTVSGFNLEIAESSSGIRHFLFSLMFASIIANYTQSLLWTKLLLFLSAVPVIFLGNLILMLTILALFKFEHEKVAHLFFFNISSILIFFFVTISLLLLSFLLKKTLRPSASSAPPC